MKKLLYCVAYEWRVRRAGKWSSWKAEFDYVHADSAGEARMIFAKAEPYNPSKQIHIANAAPVVGYFVDDNHGDSLSV